MALNELLDDNFDLSPEKAREERKNTGRAIAVFIGISLICIAIYHIWLRKTTVLAGILAPALIMFLYAIWVFYTTKRDKERKKRTEALLEASLSETIKTELNKKMSTVSSPSAGSSSKSANVLVIPNGKAPIAKTESICSQRSTDQISGVHKQNNKVLTDKILNELMTTSKANSNINKTDSRSPLTAQRSLPIINPSGSKVPTKKISVTSQKSVPTKAEFLIENEIKKPKSQNDDAKTKDSKGRSKSSETKDGGKPKDSSKHHKEKSKHHSSRESKDSTSSKSQLQKVDNSHLKRATTDSPKTKTRTEIREIPPFKKASSQTQLPSKATTVENKADDFKKMKRSISNSNSSDLPNFDCDSKSYDFKKFVEMKRNMELMKIPEKC